MTKRPRKARAKAPAPPAAPEYQPTRSLPLNLVHGDTQEQHARKVAKQILAPETAACRVINAAEGNSSFGGYMDGNGMLAEMRALQRAVNDGDMSTAEGMLMTQAISLQSLYVRLVERAMAQEWIQQMETVMRLGLKAQAQSRLAIEALATLKHGPAVLARNMQMNVAHGPQQVNNTVPTTPGPILPTVAGADAGPFDFPPSKLLSADGKDVDTGATTGAVTGDQALATLGGVNRPKN